MVFQSFDAVLALVAQVVVLLLMAGFAALSVVAFLRRNRVLVLVAAGLLALALLLAALPASSAPLVITALVSLAALAGGVLGGDPATRFVFDRTSFDEQEGAHGGIVEGGRERLRGGRMIGLLERTALVGAILAGYPEALAAIIAIKGVGRFTELETPGARERFIVGTLTSWIWASAAACVVLLVR